VSGNTTSDGISSYTWDGESQLKSAGGVNYFYDGDGRRVYKSNGKLYWYGSGGDILAETDASGNTVNEYIFFGGKRIAMLPVGGNPIYYVEDLLGTSRVLTTNTGVVCYDADFYPYGGERSYTNTCSQNNYKFEGKERDTETGNDDFGARYYSNRFGRWLSADWSAVPAPVPYANLINPQTLNLYAMVADDPESFADLDGHLTMNSGSGPCNGENESNCNSPAPPPAPQGQNQTAQPAQQRKLKINIIFSSSLSDKQRALAMGLLAHAEVGLARAGIKTKETGSQTLDFDQIKKSKGMDKGALNVVFGTNEDFSGVASSSGPNGDFRASFINVAKDGDNEAIVQFEVVQALTSRSRLPVVGLIQNAFKDGFYTNWITAALDGTPRSIRAANILTLGGVSEMKSNAVKYSDPDQ